jgi:hypothetical protein
MATTTTTTTTTAPSRLAERLAALDLSRVRERVQAQRSKAPTTYPAYPKPHAHPRAAVTIAAAKVSGKARTPAATRLGGPSLPARTALPPPSPPPPRPSVRNARLAASRPPVPLSMSARVPSSRPRPLAKGMTAANTSSLAEADAYFLRYEGEEGLEAHAQHEPLEDYTFHVTDEEEEEDYARPESRAPSIAPSHHTIHTADTLRHLQLPPRPPKKHDPVSRFHQLDGQWRRNPFLKRNEVDAHRNLAGFVGSTAVLSAALSSRGTDVRSLGGTKEWLERKKRSTRPKCTF